MTATWTTPKSWSSGELLTAADLNTYVRDNQEWLKDPITSVVKLTTAVTTASTTFVDLTGMSITVTTRGGTVLAGFHGSHTMSTGSFVYFDVAADGTRQGGTDGLIYNTSSISATGFVIPIEGLAAGSHTFKIQWRTNSGATATLYAESSASTGKVAPMFWVRES